MKTAAATDSLTTVEINAPENEEFSTRYHAALQHEPAAVMAHSTVMQLLR